MKLPRGLINGDRSSLTRVRRPFKVKTNSGTLAPKHGCTCPKPYGLTLRLLQRMSDSDLDPSSTVRFTKILSIHGNLSRRGALALHFWDKR